MNVFCIKHPKYVGKEPPQLTCKACCYIFVESIKSVKKDQQYINDASRYLVNSTKKGMIDG